MRTTDHPHGHGLLASTADAPRPDGPASRRRGKRNPWVVLAFFGLVVVSWLNSQLQ